MRKQSTLRDMSKGRGRIDLARVRATTEAEIEAQAREDGEDLIEWTPEMLARAKAKRAKKELVSVRLDPDVLEKLRAQGPGYQSRINSILRAYFSALR